MTKDMFEYENKYKGKIIAGVDEAGRGPLCGPVVCAAVIMPMDNIIEGVDDSKKLSSKKREELFEKILAIAMDYNITEIAHTKIDEINILNATKLGMKEAVLGLKTKLDIVLTDFVHIDIQIPQQNIVHGDSLSYTIAAASILAKVYRDRLMTEHAKKYPNYGFEKHKGYGTKQHIESLKRHGPCEIHRKTFIKKFVEAQNV
ncbi:MAG: ribonuclease HII [Christensenellaceae bacterium]|jgi:ribonuclease HII|nr:ribonuclease HII [Christensenellaceae bacterium]